MAGPMKQDRELAAEVRRLGLNKIKKIFEMPVVEMSDREKLMHDTLLERMAPSFVPRLNEHSGPDGGPIETKAVTGMEIVKDVPQTSIQDKKPEADPSV